MAVNMGSAVAFLELDTSKFSKGFQSAFNDLKVFGSKTATAEQKIKGLSSSMSTVGSTLTKNVTLPLAGIGAASLKVATDFESGMAEVKAISGATGEDFKKLSDKAKQMGATTKFSATQASEAFKYMSMAGWDTNDMLNSISGVMNLAAASGEDLASVSDIVTDAMTAFGLSADGTSKILKDGYSKEVSNATRFTDVLAKASSSSNTNVALMGETFKYVAPVAGALGYSVEDTATAIGLMANSGIKGSQAGTALRSTLSRLAKPTKQVQEVMDKYNISLTDSQGQMKPLKQLMEELRGAFGNLSQAEQASVAASLAGQEGMSGLMAIVNSSDEDFNKLSDSIYNANGACDEMSETMMNTTKGSLELLKSALEGAGIVIGERLQPYIRKLAEWIQKLAEWFSKLSDKQLDFIVKAGLIVAAVGPVLLIFSKLLTSITNVFRAFKKINDIQKDVRTSIKLVKAGYSGLASQMGGIPRVISSVTNGFKQLGLTLIGNVKQIGLFGGVIKTLGGVFKKLFTVINPIAILIGILIAAFVTLMATNEEFRNKMKSIWDELKQVFVDFKNKLEELGIDFGAIADGMKKAWETFCNILAPLFTTTFQTIVDFIKGVLDVILGVIDVFVGIFTGDFDQAANGVYEIFSGFIDFFSNLFGNIIDLISGVSEALGFEGAAEKLENFKNVVQEKIEIIKGIIAAFPQFIVGIIQTIISFFTETIPSALNTFATETIPNELEELKAFLDQLPYMLGYLIGELIALIIQFGQNVLGWIETEVPKMIQNVISFVEELPSKIWNLLLQVVQKVIAWGSQMKARSQDVSRQFVADFITYVKELPKKLWEIIKQLPEKVKDIKTTMKQAGKDIITSLWEGIKEIASGVLQWVEDFVGKIGSFFKGIIDGFNSVKNKGSEANEISKSVNGRHANGLDYVPFNGYVAELHKGERVLTAKENKEYNKGNATGNGGDTFNFYNTKPNPYEYARQMKQAKKELLYGI